MFLLYSPNQKCSLSPVVSTDAYFSINLVPTECPEGTPIVACSYHPCAQLFCEDEPKAVCKPHFCGGCSAEFFVGDKKITCGTEVLFYAGGKYVSQVRLLTRLSGMDI